MNPGNATKKANYWIGRNEMLLLFHQHSDALDYQFENVWVADLRALPRNGVHHGHPDMRVPCDCAEEAL